MQNDQTVTSILAEISKEVELLTERSRVENPYNTTVANRRYQVSNLNPNDPEFEKNKELASNNTEKQIKTNLNAQAGYTWKGDKVNIKKNFVNYGLPTEYDHVIEGNIESYKDPLWFYQIDGTNKLGSYLDDNGMIMPGHEDVVERVNKKYDLTLDPTQRIKPIVQDKTTKPHNYLQYLIWRDKYFIPWYIASGKQGSKLRNELEQGINGLIKPEKPKEVKTTSIEQPSPKQIDKSVIDSVVNNFSKTPAKVLIELKMIANGSLKGDYSPQQIYNTMKNLYKQLKTNKDLKGYSDTEDNLVDMMHEYKRRNPEIVEKLESVENPEPKENWLTRNGDYHIFDKLNNIFRLQKESKEMDMSNDKRKVLQETNVFNSINTNENDFDPSKVSSDVFNDDNEKDGISEKDLIKKNKLTKEVLNKINDTLKLNKEVQDILDEIREINNGNDYNIWIVNEEGNTATLASKNAKIFKQNLNLCLSHDNKIEIFKSVEELHNWLKEHNYPLPKNIQLHESVKLKEDEESDFVYSEDDPRAKFNGLGKWIEILGLDKVGMSQQDYENEKESVIDEDFCCGNMGDTTSASLGTSLQYLYKNKKKESLEKGAFIDKLKELKEDDTDVASSFDASVQSNAGFGADSSTETSDPLNNDLSSNDNMQQDDTVDLGQNDDTGDDSKEFGDTNIDLGGYGPDSGNQEEPMDMPVVEDEYQIIDVLSDSEDNIKVKVKNLTSGEIEYKDLSEIDI